MHILSVVGPCESISVKKYVINCFDSTYILCGDTCNIFAFIIIKFLLGF